MTELISSLCFLLCHGDLLSSVKFLSVRVGIKNDSKCRSHVNCLSLGIITSKEDLSTGQKLTDFVDNQLFYTRKHARFQAQVCE